MKEIENILNAIGVKWHLEDTADVKSYYCTTDTRNPTGFFVKYSVILDSSVVGFESNTETNILTKNIRGAILANI